MTDQQHILVVDDEPETLKLIGLVLKKQGFHVSEADTGVKALTAARTDTPDLIVLDVMLPDMDGYTIARALRDDPRTSHVPIVMFTAKGRIDDKAAGYEAGVDDYVTKPAHPAELLARVRAVLARKDAAPDPLDTTGTVIVCLAATPGAGATTAALNCGAALVDDDRAVRIAGFAADKQLEALAGSPAVLPADPAAKDVREKLTEVAPDLSVLPGPPEGYERDHGEAVVRALGALGGCTIVDAGSTLDARTYPLLRLADGIIIAAEPTRESLGRCHRIVTGLWSDKLGDKVAVVLLHKPHCVKQVNETAIKAGLKVSHIAVIPSMPEMMTDASPLLIRVPDHPASEIFRQFAREFYAAL